MNQRKAFDLAIFTLIGTPLSVARHSFRLRLDEQHLRGRTVMATAIEYRAMALQHHRWAGMCRSPDSREEHFRLEKELLALADSKERLQALTPEQTSNPAAVAPVKPHTAR